MLARLTMVTAALVSFLVIASTAIAEASPIAPTPQHFSFQEKQLLKVLKSNGTYAVAGNAILVAPKELQSPLGAAQSRGGATPMSSGTPPWKSCGVFDSKYKILKTYGRQKMSGVNGKSAILRCGHHNFLKDTGWGLRHIEADHGSQWKAKAALLVEPWQTFADWTWTQTLSHPSSKSRQRANDTIVYVTPVQIKNSRGEVIDRFNSRIIFARKSQNYITAYPTR